MHTDAEADRLDAVLTDPGTAADEALAALTNGDPALATAVVTANPHALGTPAGSFVGLALMTTRWDDFDGPGALGEWCHGKSPTTLRAYLSRLRKVSASIGDTVAADRLASLVPTLLERIEAATNTGM